MAMQLFYFKPVDLDQLRTWFIVEFGLIIMNYILFSLFLYVGFKIRAHINLKIMGIFLVLSYYPNLTARLVIIGFEMEIFQLKGEIGVFQRNSCSGNPGDNFYINLCTWYRVFNFGMIATIIFWVSIEREFALYYIRDYEKNHRIWIPLLLLSLSAAWCGLTTYLFVYEIVPWSLNGFALMVVLMSTLGLVFYVHTFRKTQSIVNRIYSRQVTSEYMYTLSLRFQLEENVWCGKLMKNGIITLGMINIFTFLAFVPSRLDIVKDTYGEHVCQLLDCIYNNLIAANCPTIGLGVIWQNDYLISVVKSVFFGSVVKERKSDQDEGQVYFVQLQQQWDGPLEEKGQKRSRKSGKFPFIRDFTV